MVCCRLYDWIMQNPSYTFLHELQCPTAVALDSLVFLCITSVYQIVFVTISSARLFISCLSFTCILLWMSCSWLQTMSTLIFSFHSIPERLTPPLNVSVNCTVNPAGCTITWQKPRASYEKPEHCFEYEINIQNKVKTISWFEFGTIPSYMYLHSMQCSLCLLTSLS